MLIRQEKPCGETNPHAGHMSLSTIEYICDGKTACGQWSHSRHAVETAAEVWCDGICGCGLGDKNHGLGTHK